MVDWLSEKGILRLCRFGSIERANKRPPTATFQSMNDRIAASKRRTALICTDQTEFVVELQRKLESYDIETCDRLEYLLETLKARRKNNELPDILLLELYWKKDESITNDCRMEICAEFEKLKLALDSLKGRLDSVARPHGLWFLDVIREEFPAYSLPILLTTRAGPYILEHHLIEQVLRLDAQFLIRYYDAPLTNYIVDRQIRRCKLDYDVFVSYSARDSELADEIVSLLQKKKLRVFIARKSIEAGEVWTKRLKAALQSSRSVLLLLTPNSLNSDWVKTELGASWVLDKKVIPVYMHIDLSRLPSVMSQFQMRSFETGHDRNSLVEEIYSLVQINPT